MRRIAKIIVILFIIALVFFVVCYISPDVKAAVDNAVGPTVSGFLGAVGASITGSPVWQNYIVATPHQWFIGLFCGLAFAWFIHLGFNRVRTVFVRSAERESGTAVFKEPISQVTAPKPTPIEEKKKEAEASEEK